MSRRGLLQLTLQVLDVVDRRQDGFQVRRRGRWHDSPQPWELLGGDVHQHLPSLLHLLHHPAGPRLLPDRRPLLPQVGWGRWWIIARLWWLLHTDHLSNLRFLLPKVLLLCFLGSNWSESSHPPAYINCRPVPRSHWSKTSRAATERSDWPSARVVVVWNFHGIPLHWEGQLRCVRIGANCPGPWVAKSRQIRNWVSPPILQIKPWLFWDWAHLILSSMLEVFVLCNRGTKQLMTKGIQLPDNYSGTDEDGIESFQKWGKVLFYKT